MTVSVTFSIWTEKFSPDEVTSELGVRPDRAAIRGFERVPARAMPSKHGWHLTAETESDAPAEEFLKPLLTRTHVFRDALLRLQALDSDLEVRITIHFDHSRSDTSLDLSPSIIADLAALRARVFIDRVDLSIGNH